MCRLKDHPMTPALVGISSQHKFLKNNGTKSSIVLENVSDLYNTAFREELGYLGY